MKKMLALLLTLCLLAGLVPLGAGAEEGTSCEGGKECTHAAAIGDKHYDTLQGAIDAATSGAKVTLCNDIKPSVPITVSKTLTLDLAGHKISNTTPIWTNTEDEKRWSLIRVSSGGNLTITGNGFLDALKDDCYAVDLYDTTSKCTIDSGKFTGNIHAVYVYNGHLTVNGGTFSVKQKFPSEYPYEYVLNCYDANYQNETASITVNGGTFLEFNPQNCRAEGEDTNFCAEGYTTSSETQGEHTIYTVIPPIAKVGQTYCESLGEAIDKAANGDTVTLLRDASTEPITINKGITLDLGGNTLTLIKDDSTSPFGLDFSNNGDNVLKNGVICDERSKDTTFAGFISVRLTGDGTLTIENAEIQNYQPDSEANYNYILRADGGTGTLNLKSGTKLTELERTTHTNKTYGTVGVALFGPAKTQDTMLSQTINLVIEDGVSINTMGFAISGNGSDSNGTNITINGGEIVSNSAQAIYHPQYGTLTIQGGKITGNTGIEMRSGILNVSGSAIITGTGTPISVGPNGNGSTTAGVGIAVAQHTTKLPIIVNISGGTISGYTGFYESNPQNNSTADLEKIELSISGGQFSSINGGVNSIYSEDCSKFISSGYFTSDPSDYVADGYYAGESDNAAYAYKVKPGGNEDTPAEVVAAEPDVKAAPGIDNTVTTALSGTTADLTAAANEQAADNKVTEGTAREKLKEAGIITGGGTGPDVTVVVQPYLAMEAKSYDGTNGTMTVDIKAMYRTVATTAKLGGEHPDKIIVSGEAEVGETANAVVIGEKENTLPVEGPVKISIPLPTGFITGTESGTLPTIYVQHENIYEYKADVTSKAEEGSYTATFTNPHGFSTFVLSTKSETVATVNGTNYTNFQQAVEDAGANGTVTVQKGGQTATGVTHDLKLENGTGGQITVTINGKTITINAGKTETFTYTAPTPPRPTEEKHGITISTDGKGQVTGPASAAEDDKVTLTVKPNADKELYDLKVTDEDGKAIAVTKVNDTTYTFTMPDGKVTVAATFGCDGGDNCPSKAFTDLGDKQWYHDFIDYAVENGLLEGTSPTTMEPNATLIRAQLAQILYNIEDKPAVTGEMIFEDVPASEWFYSPILWANQNEIINGTSATTFEPLENISRQDLALMLYRYAGKPAVTGDLDGFTDADQVGDWAEEAMAWAVAEGIVQGDTPTTLNPTGTATRAEAAAMLQRFLENAA